MLFSVFLIPCFLGNAQDKYYPYLDTTARWYFKKIVSTEDMYQTQLDTYERYSFKKDTVIDNNQCYRAYCLYRGYPHEISLGLFYEIDSIVSMLYNIQNDTYSSAVSYDFNFEADEIVDYSGYLLSIKTDIVESIGSVKYFDIGEPWGVYYNGERVVWSANLYHEVSMELLCYERDGKIIYQNPDFSSCWPDDTTAIKEVKESHIVPSVLKENVLIKTAGYENISLISSDGRKVLAKHLGNSDFYELQIESLPSNIYWLILTDERGNGVKQKLTLH